MQVAHQVRVNLDDIDVTGKVPTVPLVRLLCHLLVDHIPDRGVPELCESLGGMYEFYAIAPEHPPLLPRQQRITGVRGRSYERPEFHIEEE